MPSQVISDISIKDASWVDTPDLPLNPGLVAVIGARGSGKTALVDMIAAGCEAISSSAWNGNEHISPSFLSRARPHLSDSKIEVKWAGGSSGTKFLDGSDADGHFSFPRARYLSQQFVEDLCSSAGISDGLIDEIERVIFESYPVDDREGAIDFLNSANRRLIVIGWLNLAIPDQSPIYPSELLESSRRKVGWRRLPTKFLKNNS